jgi:hypothetical protein
VELNYEQHYESFLATDVICVELFCFSDKTVQIRSPVPTEVISVT